MSDRGEYIVLVAIVGLVVFGVVAVVLALLLASR